MGSLLEQSVCLSPVSPLSNLCSQGKLGTVLALPVDAVRRLALQVCSLGPLYLEKMCVEIASLSRGRC